MYLQLALDTRTKNVDLAPDPLRDHPFSMYACILESRNIPFAGNVANVLIGYTLLLT